MKTKDVYFPTMERHTLKSHYRTRNLTSVLQSDAVDSCQLFTFSEPEPVQLNPDGHFEFIIQTQGEFRHKTHGKEWTTRPRIFIGGLHNKAFQVQAMEQSASLISVRLKIEQARNFLPGSLEAYKNTIVDLYDLFSRAQLAPLERLCEERNALKCARHVDAFLKGVKRPHTGNALDFLLHEIHRLKGDMRLSEMSEFTGCSISGLRTLFAREVGMSPKEYAKIVRFNHVALSMERNRSSSLTEIAYAMGYYDQAHFIKDFRSITGLAPKEFRRQLAG